MTLSVVLTVIDGGDALARCGRALLDQVASEPFEILVPVDETLPPLPAWFSEHPAVRVLPMPLPSTRAAWDSAAAQHELYDRRRAVGLAAADGDVIAMIEDRVVPQPGWVEAYRTLHAAIPAAVIGGAIVCRSPNRLTRALYLCDYGRYRPPFAAGPRGYVSDVNLAYKREPLRRLIHLWRDRYHETTVHWALHRDGSPPWLTPDVRVEYAREGVRWRVVLRERVAWGRLFAVTRTTTGSRRSHWARALASPLLPFVLLGRLLRSEWHPGRRGPFVRAAPAIFLLLSAWSAGECVGYVTRSA